MFFFLHSGIVTNAEPHCELVQPWFWANCKC